MNLTSAEIVKTEFKNLLENEDIKRLDFITRYSSIPVVHHENVSQHSYWVAFYALVIHKIIDGDDNLTGTVLTAAIIHDLPEVYTGDIVRTFKYSSKSLKKEINKAEEYAILSFPHIIKELFTKSSSLHDNDDFYVKSVVKAADFVSLFNYMQREMSLHNSDILPFYQRMISDLEQEKKETFIDLQPLYKEMIEIAIHRVRVFNERVSL